MSKTARDFLEELFNTASRAPETPKAPETPRARKEKVERKDITPIETSLERYWVSVALSQQIIIQNCKCGNKTYVTANHLVKQINTMKSGEERQIDARKIPTVDLLRLPRDVNYVNDSVACCHECLKSHPIVDDNSKQLDLF